MNRIALTDESGRWFDEEKADDYKEGGYWNGSNNISLATKSQFEHERLYRTAGGKWILNKWSSYQGTMESYEEIAEEDAAKWLCINGKDAEVVKKLIKELEI